MDCFINRPWKLPAPFVSPILISCVILNILASITPHLQYTVLSRPVAVIAFLVNCIGTYMISGSFLLLAAYRHAHFDNFRVDHSAVNCYLLIERYNILRLYDKALRLACSR